MNLTPPPTYAWRIAHAAVAGRSHVRRQVPCQDAAAAARTSAGVAVCLCDGAGSARHAHIGAATVAAAVVEFLAGGVNGLWEGRTASDAILDCARKAVDGAVQSHGGEPEDYACTLMGVAVAGRRAVVVHLGDGVTVVVDRDVPLALTRPDNGEFANETYFVTSSGAAGHLRIMPLRVTSATEGFVLMTDGAQTSLYDARTGSVSQAVSQALFWLDQVSEGIVCEHLQRNIQEHLLPQTLDDCSIALLRRRRVPKRMLRQPVGGQGTEERA